MIDEEMLAFWIRHRSDPDILDRGSVVLTADQWTSLQEMASGIRVIQQGLASSEFQARIERQIYSELSRSAAEKFLQVARG